MNKEDHLILVTNQQQWLNPTYRSQKDIRVKNAIFNYPHQPIDNFTDSDNDFDDYGISQLNIEQNQRIISPINGDGLLRNNYDANFIFKTNIPKPQLPRLSGQLRPFLHLLDEDINLCTLPKCIFMPDGKIIQSIQILFFMFYTVLLFSLPLQITLDNSNNFQYYLVFIIIEIGCKLLTGVIVEGEIVMNIRSILKHYKRKYLIGDIILLSLFVLLMIINQVLLQNIFLIGGLFLIQSKRMTYEYHFQLFYGIYDKLVIFLTHILNYLMILNLLGCLLLQIVKEIDFFYSLSISDQYFKSIYSIIDLNSHIYPESSLQTIGIASINVIYIFLNAYILIEFYEFMKIDKSFIKLHQYFKEHQPDLPIKIKLLSDVGKLNQFQFYKEQIEKLNQSKEKRQVLCRYFKNLKLKTINQLVVKATIENYQQNEVIIQQDEADDSSIYFVLEGQVQIKSKNGTVLNRLNKSNHFGELSFYTNQVRTATVVSQVYCRLLKLSRSDFLSGVNFLEKVQIQQKQQQQSFFYISDMILQKIQMPNRCFCCHSQDHYIHSCPKLIYHPNPLQILQKDEPIISVSIRQEGNKKFGRHRQTKLRTPYNTLRKIDVSVYEQMRIDYQRVSSSISSEGDLPYENDTQKYSNSEIMSTSPKKSESNRKIGIDYELSNSLGSKNLQTIFERVEDEDSPEFDKQQHYKVFVTKSQEGPQLHINNSDQDNINDRMRSKSQQQVNLGRIEYFDEIQSNFRVFVYINKDLESIDLQLQDFERMEQYSQYFPNNNYTNTITRANLTQYKSHDE